MKKKTLEQNFSFFLKKGKLLNTIHKQKRRARSSHLIGLCNTPHSQHHLTKETWFYRRKIF